jgi:hypothetical protein
MEMSTEVVQQVMAACAKVGSWPKGVMVAMLGI